MNDKDKIIALCNTIQQDSKVPVRLTRWEELNLQKFNYIWTCAYGKNNWLRQIEYYSICALSGERMKNPVLYQGKFCDKTTLVQHFSTSCHRNSPEKLQKEGFVLQSPTWGHPSRPFSAVSLSA